VLPRKYSAIVWLSILITLFITLKNAFSIMVGWPFLYSCTTRACGDLSARILIMTVLTVCAPFMLIGTWRARSVTRQVGWGVLAAATAVAAWLIF
jgi:hypothetical protein